MKQLLENVEAVLFLKKIIKYLFVNVILFLNSFLTA